MWIRYKDRDCVAFRLKQDITLPVAGNDWSLNTYMQKGNYIVHYGTKQVELTPDEFKGCKKIKNRLGINGL